MTGRSSIRSFLILEDEDMITIELIQKGRSKVYKARGISLRLSLDAYDIFRDYSAAGGDYKRELLDRCAQFVCDVFGNAFTVEDLETGYQGSAFVLYPSMLNAVIGYTAEAVANFPEPSIMTASEMTKD